MKSSVRFSLISVVMLLFCLQASAQPDRGRKDNAWHEKMQAEKVAFLTTEMDLTPQEAQVFWPVYNQSEKEHFRYTEAVFKAFWALDQAIQSGKSGKEVADLLDAYKKASAAAAEIDSKYIDKYLKILSSDKVARLVVGEEKFRQFQIHKLRPGPGPAKDQSGNQTKK